MYVYLNVLIKRNSPDQKAKTEQWCSAAFKYILLYNIE